MKVLPAVFVLAGAAAVSAQNQTLNGLFQAKGKYVGTSADNSEFSDPKVLPLLAKEAGVFTPGNAMKWDQTEKTQNVFTFTAANTAFNTATNNGMKVRGHTLVWHSQLPTWVSGGNWTYTQLSDIIVNHITNVMGQWKGQILHWDVVNEIFNDDGTYRPSVFYQTMGTDFVPLAFNTARSVDPNAKLYINDYNTDGVNAKSTALYNLVQNLTARGVPIDGVGFQAHQVVGQVPSTLQQNYERFAALGVDVAITELDIRTNTPATDAALKQQQTDYQTNFAACLNVPRCVGISIWGMTDAHSWIPSTFSGQGAALPYDEYYNYKPAYNGIVAALGGTPVTIPPKPAASSSIPTGAVTIYAGSGNLASGWGDWSYGVNSTNFYNQDLAAMSGNYVAKVVTNPGLYGIPSYKGPTSAFTGMDSLVVYIATDSAFSLGLSASSENYYNGPQIASSKVCASAVTSAAFVKCTLPIASADTAAHAWDRIMIWTNTAGPQTVYLSSIYLQPKPAAVSNTPPTGATIIYQGKGLESGWGDWSWSCTNNAYWSGPPTAMANSYVFQGVANPGNYGGVSIKGTTAAFSGSNTKLVFYAAADWNSTATPNWTVRLEATTESYFASAEFPFSKVCTAALSTTAFTRCELSFADVTTASGTHAWDRVDFMSKVNTGQTIYLGYIWTQGPDAGTCTPTTTTTTTTTTSTSVVTVTAPGTTVTSTETTTMPAATITAPGVTVTSTQTAATQTVTQTSTATVTSVVTATPTCVSKKSCNGKYLDISCCDNGTMCIKTVLANKSEYWNCVSYADNILSLFGK
ncbi:hypothetical protein HDV00_000419 [Rhizophlyctis rosea]|nr:hypothetical protein HDV00_000419 [Rhizophlyctis rosea]